MAAIIRLKQAKPSTPSSPPGPQNYCNMSAHSILSRIRSAEQLLADTRRDIDDSWRIVGAMLRELRKKRGLTQAAAAALVARDAAIVQRWERGNCANVQDIQNYIKKLESV